MQNNYCAKCPKSYASQPNQNYQQQNQNYQSQLQNPYAKPYTANTQNYKTLNSGQYSAQYSCKLAS